MENIKISCLLKGLKQKGLSFNWTKSILNNNGEERKLTAGEIEKLLNKKTDNVICYDNQLWIYCNEDNDYSKIEINEIDKLIEVVNEKIDSYENKETGTSIYLSKEPNNDYVVSINEKIIICEQREEIDQIINILKNKTWFKLVD